jgi:hypothetical protein
MRHRGSTTAAPLSCTPHLTSLQKHAASPATSRQSPAITDPFFTACVCQLS